MFVVFIVVEKLFRNFVNVDLHNVGLGQKLDLRHQYVEFLNAQNQPVLIQCGRLPIEFFYFSDSVNFSVFFSTSLFSSWTFFFLVESTFFV